MATYQVALNYAVFALGGAVLVALADYVARGGQAMAETWTRIRFRAFALAIGFGIYLALLSATLYFSGSPLESRAEVIGIGDIPTRVATAWGWMRTSFAASEPVAGLGIKILWLALAGLTFGALALKSRHTMNCAMAAVLWLAILLAAAYFLPTFAWIAKVAWIVPRVESHIGLLLAAVVASLIAIQPSSRRAILVVTTVGVLGLAAASSSILIDQHRVNLRDLSLANRIVARAESLQEYSQVKRAIVEGGFWGFANPIATAQGDLNISALYPSWSKKAILEEVSGRRFDAASIADLSAAKEHCAKSAPWPGPDAVAIVNGLLVVCLPQ